MQHKWESLKDQINIAERSKGEKLLENIEVELMSKLFLRSINLALYAKDIGNQIYVRKVTTAVSNWFYMHSSAMFVISHNSLSFFRLEHTF